MSNPAFLKRIEKAKKRREGYVNNSLSGSLRQPQYQPESNFMNWRYESNRSGNPNYIDFSDDNFVMNYQGGVAVERPAANSSTMAYGQQASTLPMNKDPIEFVIDPKKIVMFHGTHYLSNLARSKITIEGYSYGSVEHYYQACKLYTLAGSNVALQMANVQDPRHCKGTVKQLLQGIADNRTVETWKRREAPEILIHALCNKFAQNQHLRQKLLATEDAILMHTFAKDSVWATGMTEEATVKWATDNAGKTIKIPRVFEKTNFENHQNLCQIGKGKNILGVLLMMVREALRPDLGRADPRIVSLVNSLIQ